MNNNADSLLVSAIIITHNRKELLVRAIESVKRQSYPHIECIVVDDNSTDGTREYLESLDGIRYIRIDAEESRGGNYARNKGILASKGAYIALLDDDDAWLEEKIEKQMALALEKQGDVVYCGTTTELIKGESVRQFTSLPQPDMQGNLYPKILLTIHCTTTSHLLIKKDTLVKVGMFDESLRFWQDYELTIRLAKVTPFYFVNEPLCLYRKDETDKHRLTNNYEQWKVAVDSIYEKYRKDYESLSFFDRTYVHKIWIRDGLKRAKKSRLKWIHFKLKISFLLLGLINLPRKVRK